MTGLGFISRAPIGLLHGMEGDRDAEMSLPDRSFTIIRVKLHEGMGTARQDIASLTIDVHKSCAWFVDNHVDEQPIPCRTTAPHTLPNQ